eukprot:comp14795_c0_seq1/m.21659 comp14795_c0_seq1/g.21659  ORF comp14795_c0_seq1/g.21659 comp14795_c0_seq1/m.21659 type:complete len:331 (-) comp14795_c0_seq1:527-1519(-)
MCMLRRNMQRTLAMNVAQMRICASFEQSSNKRRVARRACKRQRCLLVPIGGEGIHVNHPACGLCRLGIKQNHQNVRVLVVLGSHVDRKQSIALLVDGGESLSENAADFLFVAVDDCIVKIANRKQRSHLWIAAHQCKIVGDLVLIVALVLARAILQKQPHILLASLCRRKMQRSVARRALCADLCAAVQQRPEQIGVLFVVHGRCQQAVERVVARLADGIDLASGLHNREPHSLCLARACKMQRGVSAIVDGVDGAAWEGEQCLGAFGIVQICGPVERGHAFAVEGIHIDALFSQRGTHGLNVAVFDGLVQRVRLDAVDERHPLELGELV